MAGQKQRLLELFNNLDAKSRGSLLDYAEFLQHRISTDDIDPLADEKQSPLHQPRPKEESVINAIKRLKTSYFMLDTDGMLNETTSLMTQFMLQGRDAVEVIDDLEALFDRHYQDYLQS